jgi:hypothetical protein
MQSITPSAAPAWPFLTASVASHPGVQALLEHLQSDKSGLLQSTEAVWPQAEAGLQRIPELTLIPRARLSSLQSAHSRFLAAQKSYLHASLLRQHVHSCLGQLVAETSEDDADADTVRDLEMYWRMIQAEEYLQMDGTGAGAAGAGGQASQVQFGMDGDEATAANPSPPPKMFGLDWQSLSTSFRPRSSGIPSAHSTSRNPSSVAPSFTAPSPAFLSSLHSVLLPSVSASISDQDEALMEAFDADGEQRREEEERAQTREERIAGLAPLDSSSLSSLLTYRLARTHSAQVRRRSEQRLVGSARREHDDMLLENLRLTAGLLRLQLESEFATTTTTSWLAAKAAVIASKAEKLQAEIMRDTYLGVPQQGAAAGGTRGSASSSLSDPRHILPSLQIIHSSLSQLHSSTARDLRDKERAVSEYRAVGAQFDRVAVEYAALRRQIENKKWTIKELHAHAGGDLRQMPRER